MKLVKVIKSIIKGLMVKKFGKGIKGDKKYEFEKGIIELLRKFDLYDEKNKALQSVEIKASVDKFPVVKIEYTIINREEK